MEQVEFYGFNKEERAIIDNIIDRAVEMCMKNDGSVLDKLTLRMDISAVYVHTPLKLEALFETDDFNFAHDVFGIMRNIDRQTGELANCFLPRFTQ